MFLLAGIAKFLFIPLAEAVVFAMLASYLLSRTLVPTLSKYWLTEHSQDQEPGKGGLLRRFQARFEHEKCASGACGHWWSRICDDRYAVLRTRCFCVDSWPWRKA
jgi:multidrug efflux pump subunit AcrB